MEILENAIKKAKDNARVIGEILREVCRVCPQAAELVGQDLANPELSLENCAAALYGYAKKHQKGGGWSCAVFGIDPENEAVRVILDFYKVPVEWLTSAPERPVSLPPAAPVSTVGGTIDLMGLL